MAAESKAKQLTWSLRVAVSDDELVRAASERTEIGYSAFVREAAVQEARRVLADQRSFELDDQEWQRFSDALERPARVPNGLLDLYLRRSVFEED